MSMTERGKFEVYVKKLQGICDEHNLVYGFKKNAYPITLTIRATSDMSGQMSLLADDESNNHISRDAKLIFSYKDGTLDICITDGKFRVNDALFNKLKNLFIKMHYLWLQYFHREIIDNDALPKEDLPVIKDEDGGDIVSEVFDEIKDDIDRLEEFEDGEDEDDGDYPYDDSEDESGSADPDDEAG